MTNTPIICASVSRLDDLAVTDRELRQVEAGCDMSADFSRRQRLCLFVVAEENDGTRHVHLQGFAEDGADEAEALAARVRVAGEIATAYWGYHYPAYGSEASKAEEREAVRYAPAECPEHLRSWI